MELRTLVEAQEQVRQNTYSLNNSQKSTKLRDSVYLLSVDGTWKPLLANFGEDVQVRETNTITKVIGDTGLRTLTRNLVCIALTYLRLQDKRERKIKCKFGGTFNHQRYTIQHLRGYISQLSLIR